MPTLNTTTITKGGGDGGSGTAYPVYEVVGIKNANRFMMRTGASRYGVGVFLMLRSDWNDISNESSVTLDMQSGDGDPSPGLSLQMVPVKAEACITTPGDDDTSELVKATFYDMRCQNYDVFAPNGESQGAAYNVMMDGFPQDSGQTKCYDETTNSGSPYSWDYILGRMFTSQPTPDDSPDWKPYNLIWDAVPICRVIDDVARRLFYVVAYDHQANDADFGCRLQAPGDSLDANDSLHNDADPYITAGGLADRNQQRLPGQCDVVFQVANLDTSDPFAQRIYTSSQSIPNGNGDLKCTLHIGEYIVIYAGGSMSTGGADNIASDMVSRLAGWQWQDFGQQEYVGIWPFRPDGQWRQVEWISDSQGARTILSNDNRFDWNPEDSTRDPINPYANQDLTPVGSVNVAAGSMGAKCIWKAGMGLPSGVQYQVFQRTLPSYGPPDALDYVRFHG